MTGEALGEARSPPASHAFGDARGPVGFPPALYAWFVLTALSLANTMSYVERQILTLLFTPIKRDFRLTDTEVSLLAGAAFVLFYVGFGLIIGRLADRTNRKRIIMVGVVFWSLATTACGLAQNFAQLFIARISVGVGEATLGPSALSIISDYFPRHRLARAISIYTGAQFVGAGLALVVGGLALDLVSGLPPVSVPSVGVLRHWQMTFLLVGLGGLFVLLPLAFMKEPIRQGVTRRAAFGVGRSELVAFLATNRRFFIAHFSGFAISSMVGFGTVAWIPTFFIRVHHWAPQSIGYVYGLMLAVLGGAGVLAGARLAELMERRGVIDAYLRLPMISMCATSAFLIAALFAPNPTAAVVLLGVSTFLSSFPVALIISALQIVTPNQLRGQVISIYYFIANVLGVASGPTVIAVLTDYLYRDERAVGFSLATVSGVITPIVIIILAFGLRGYRESLAQATALHSLALNIEVGPSP